MDTVLRHFDAVSAGNPIVEFGYFATVSTPDHAVDPFSAGKLDLDPAGPSSVVNPAVFVPEPPVVQVVNLVDFEAGQKPGGGRLRTGRGTPYILIACRPKELNLIEAWLGTVAGRQHGETH